MKQLKHFLTLFLFAAAIIVLNAAPSRAMSITTLNTDDTWQSGNISTAGEADFYEITTTKTGWLTVTYQGWDVGDSYYHIQSEDLAETFYNKELCTSTDTAPLTDSKTLCLEAGTYYVKVNACGSHTGDYRLKASFTACNNNETEPNDNFLTAQSLSYNKKITGALTEQDQLDFYKITLSSDTTVRIYYTSYINDSYMSIWDDNQLKEEQHEVWSCSEDNPQTYMYEGTLSQGTHYIKISPYGSNTGRYDIKVIQKVMAKSISISGNQTVVPGKSFTLKASFSPSNTTDKTVKWTSGNSSVASVNETTGKVTANGVGKVKITASAQDGSNKSKTITVYVKPAKETIYSLYQSGSRCLYMSCKYQNGATGYQIQYSTSKKFTKAVSKKTKNTYIYLKSLKKKVRYYVRVRAYYKVSSKTTLYGAWSSAKSAKATY